MENASEIDTNLSSHKPETPTIDDKKEDVENVVKGKGSQPQTDDGNANVENASEIDTNLSSHKPDTPTIDRQKRGC